MNDERENATATLLPNGKVLIAGGAGAPNPGPPLSSTDLYDPATNTFAPSTPSMNEPRARATATLLPNGKVLIAGGTNDTSTELYNPVTNSFAAADLTPAMNVARGYFTATLLPNGKVLFAGGIDNAFNLLSSTELYDPATNKFAPAASTPTMNAARPGATATLLSNGKVLFAGGINSYPYPLASTELYDTNSNTFAPPTSTPVMNIGRTGATATLLSNGKVLIAGGLISDAFKRNMNTNTTDLYDPANNTFATSTPVMNTARSDDTATLLPNGKVLIAGGDSAQEAGNVWSSTDLYTP